MSKHQQPDHHRGGHDRGVVAVDAGLARFFPDGVPTEGVAACEHCNSEFSISAISPGISSINIRHDDWCPLYQQLQGGRA